MDLNNKFSVIECIQINYYFADRILSLGANKFAVQDSLMFHYLLQLSDFGNVQECEFSFWTVK